MAQRGRPRTPTNTLKLHNTFRKDRRNVGEPEPNIEIPERPKWLTGEGRREWERIAPLLARMKCLTEWDRSMLAAYCFEWGMYVMLCRKTKKLKDTVVYTTNGNEVQNPLLTARNRALKNWKELAIEFGLSPSARSRLDVDVNSGNNEFVKLLKGGNDAG